MGVIVKHRVDLPTELHAWLDQCAHRNGCSISDQIVEILQDRKDEMGLSQDAPPKDEGGIVLTAANAIASQVERNAGKKAATTKSRPPVGKTATGTKVVEKLGQGATITTHRMRG